MTQPTDLPNDPTLAVAERQLAMLAELAEMAMAASRAFKMSAIAASKAETMILGEEWFVPEVGRARACGAKDAAESLQKVTRAVRLTLKLEMTVAEIVRDIRAGKTTYIGGLAPGKDAGETPAVQLEPELVDRRRLAGSYSASHTPDRERLDREPRDSESLTEFDRPDRFPRAAFGRVVAGKDADEDVGAPAEEPRTFSRSADVIVGPSRADTPDRERFDREPRDSESLVEFDRPDTFPRAQMVGIADCKDAAETPAVRVEPEFVDRRRPAGFYFAADTAPRSSIVSPEPPLPP